MKRTTNTSYFVKIAMLGVLAYVIMLIEFSLPIFPSFLKMDFSDLVPLICSLALGPVAGMLTELIKCVLHWATASTTGGIGDIANFIVGSAFVMTAGAIYSRHKTRNGAMAALFSGVAVMVAAGGLMNYFVMVPFYGAAFFGEMGGVDGVVEFSAKIIPAINSKLTLVLYAFCPFNLLKGLVLTIITIPLYKKLSPLLHIEHLKRGRKSEA